MKITVIANFVGDKKTNRFVYLTQTLARRGHEVKLLTSDFVHYTKSFRDEFDLGKDVQVVLLHETGYKKNVSLKRLRSHARFGKEVKKYLAANEKPDLIYCALPSLDCGVYAAKYAKEQGVPFVIDVQDLWPEAFEMVMPVPFIGKALFAPMRKKANFAYAAADEIIAVSKTYCKRVQQVNNAVKETHSVFLGSRLSGFDENVAKNRVERTDNEVWFAYCGTLGSSYDLKCALDALAILGVRGYENLRFKVMGDGPMRKEFEAYADKMGVKAEFFGYMPYEKMCGLLASCDIALNPIVKGSAGSIINKHGDYAAAGIPVVNTQENGEYRALVEEYGMGFNAENGNAGDMADKIETLLNNKALCQKMGAGARKCAEEKFNRDCSYQEIVETIEKYGK